jgi:hypothetical protein
LSESPPGVDEVDSLVFLKGVANPLLDSRGEDNLTGVAYPLLDSRGEDNLKGVANQLLDSP